MLFIGHFSFDEIDADGKPKHGYFSSIVDADGPDTAVAKFETHIKKMKGSLREMVNVVNVYIEEILRIANIPESPMITRLQSSEGEFPPSVSHSLPVWLAIMRRPLVSRLISKIRRRLMTGASSNRNLLLPLTFNPWQKFLDMSWRQTRSSAIQRTVNPSSATAPDRMHPLKSRAGGSIKCDFR